MNKTRTFKTPEHEAALDRMVAEINEMITDAADAMRNILKSAVEREIISNGDIEGYMEDGESLYYPHTIMMALLDEVKRGHIHPVTEKQADQKRLAKQFYQAL